MKTQSFLVLWRLKFMRVQHSVSVSAGRLMSNSTHTPDTCSHTHDWAIKGKGREFIHGRHSYVYDCLKSFKAKQNIGVNAIEEIKSYE